MSTRQCVKIGELRKLGFKSIKEWLEDKTNVYCGRKTRVPVSGEMFFTPHSKWCNTFKIGKNCTDIDECLRLYKQSVVGNSDLLGDINSLRGKNLGCFCLPGEKCHVDFLCDLVNSDGGLSELFDIKLQIEGDSPVVEKKKKEETPPVVEKKKTTQVFLNIYEYLKSIKLGDITVDSSTQGKSKLHEKAVEDVIRSQFTEITRNEYKNLYNFKDGQYFVSQPNGKQKSPDIIIFTSRDGVIKNLKIECKSGNTYSIFWNDGLPTEDCIYHFYNYKTSKSLLIGGYQLVSGVGLDVLMDAKKEVKKLNTYKRKVLKDSGSSFYCTIRSANTQNISKITNMLYDNFAKYFLKLF